MPGDQSRNIAALVVARLGSSRLPEKHLARLHGKTMIEHVVDRVRKANQIGKIILCTTTKKEDLKLVAIADRIGIDHYQGSELNLIRRFYDTAQYFGIGFSVIVEADEVLCDWEWMDKIVSHYLKCTADYIQLRGMPLGSYLHGLATSALEKIVHLLPPEAETDGWNRYFMEKGTLPFRVETLQADYPGLCASEVRLTLDWPEDLVLIKELFQRLYKDHSPFTLLQALHLLRREPELLKINRHLIEIYAKRVAQFQSPDITIKEGL